jgi:riboflavin synthase
MFTGIVAAVGEIRSVVPVAGKTGDVRLQIEAAALGMDDVALGDSIAVNGACLTVESKTADGFSVYASLETLQKTVGLTAPGKINLEKALRLQDRIGGHLVTGHVDGIGTVAQLAEVGQSWLLVVTVPAHLARYFADKGSITVDGVSLTVNRVSDHAGGCDVHVNLIPHTWQNTTLHQLAVGSAVNIEIDLIARYTGRMLAAGG